MATVENSMALSNKVKYTHIQLNTSISINLSCRNLHVCTRMYGTRMITVTLKQYLKQRTSQRAIKKRMGNLVPCTMGNNYTEKLNELTNIKTK